MLLTKLDTRDLSIDPSSVRATRDALRRAGNIGYHLRWKYVWPRAQQLASYVGEHLLARRRVARLLAMCHKAGKLEAEAEPAPLRRAA
jgi:hypothetical protein